MDPESTDSASGRLGSMTWLEGSIFRGKILLLAKQRQLDGSHFFDIRPPFLKDSCFPHTRRNPTFTTPGFCCSCPPAKRPLPSFRLAPSPPSYLLSWSSGHCPDDHAHVFGFTLVQFCWFWERVLLCSSSWACIQNLSSPLFLNADQTKVSGPLIRWHHATSCVSNVQKEQSEFLTVDPISSSCSKTGYFIFCLFGKPKIKHLEKALQRAHG